MLANLSYKERDTLIQRLDPRARLIFAACAVLATVLLWDLRWLLALLALALGQFLLARLTWRETRRFWLFVTTIFVVLTLLTLLTGRGGVGVYARETPIWQGRALGLTLTLSAERLAFAAAQLVRLFTMALLTVVLPYTIHPACYGIAFRRLGLPDNLAFALDLSFRFIPSLARDFSTTLDAQRARGYELERAGGLIRAIRNTAPLIIPVTIGAVLKGEDVIDAMNLHAFGTGPRTWTQELRYQPRDVALIGLGVVLLAGALALALLGYAGLWIP